MPDGSCMLQNHWTRRALPQAGSRRERQIRRWAPRYRKMAGARLTPNHFIDIYRA